MCITSPQIHHCYHSVTILYLVVCVHHCQHHSLCVCVIVNLPLCVCAIVKIFLGILYY